MNARQFYEEVKKMRYLQKKYFLTRDHRALEASKKFEKRIDAEIERVEPEYVESGCVPETYNEYVERNREISIPEKASCKNCKHCIYCNKVDYPGIKSSFHYCDIFTYGKNDIALKLYQSRQLCGFSRYESK